jgi:hypothetical protein
MRAREDTLLDPQRHTACIRAFFHPDWVRRGIGCSTMVACERVSRESRLCLVDIADTQA